MKNLIPLFRTDSIAKWGALREKVWKDAESHYEQALQAMRKNLNHLVYLCSPLKPTKQKLVQNHIAEAIFAAGQILGAKYDGRKIAVWIPHVHLFSIYNEILYPEVREKAIKFNNRLIKEYFHTLTVHGNTISTGMAAEIELAKKNGVKVIGIEDFKRQLKNLPDPKKSEASYRKMVYIHNQIHGHQFLIKHEHLEE